MAMGFLLSGAYRIHHQTRDRAAYFDGTVSWSVYQPLKTTFLRMHGVSTGDREFFLRVIKSESAFISC